MLFQIFLIAFALFAITRTIRQYKTKAVSKYWMIVFCAFWVVVAVVAITPQSTDVVARSVGVGRGADLLVYIAIVTLFYVVYRLVIRQQKLQEELTELVRHEAIEKVKKQ